MHRPGSLFVQIFLWFWVAIALLILGVAGVQTLSWRSEGPPRITDRNLFTAYAGAVVDGYERDGLPAAQHLIAELKRAQLRGYLLDDQARSLVNPAPAGVVEVARRALVSHRPEYLGWATVPVMARPVRGASGKWYVFANEVRRTPPSILRIFRGNQWLLLLVGVLTAGLVCYALARHLTAPLVRLRTAARRLAEGDLTARAGVGARRRDELADLGRDFDRMAERLEESMESQRRLLRDISHELRSPLARMSVALGIARQRRAASDEALDRIEIESARLNELIGELLTLSRFESGQPPMERVPVELDATVRQVAENARFEAQARGREVRVARCDSCMLLGQAALLESAIENVVRNAVRHTPNERAVEISLRCDEDPHSAVILVRDFGPGVPEEELPRLFRPFHRVGDARDRQSGGVGLGLAITDRAVRLHGGTVTARNAPGGGLLVEIRLPLDIESQPEEAPNPEARTALA